MKPTYRDAVAVRDILANADNPRVLDRKAAPFRELVESVRAVGVQVPVCLTPEKYGKRYRLRAGTRRVEAAKVAGRKAVPALVYKGLTGAEAFELTFVENFAREDLTPLEQSRAIDILLKRNGKDLDAVAARLGRSLQWVELRVRLQALTTRWQRAVADPRHCVSGWGAGHLVLIARFDPKVQDDVLRTLAYPGSNTRAMTVKGLQKYLQTNVLHRLTVAPWELEDPKLLKKAGACSKCRKRTSLQGRLFHAQVRDIQKNDQCLDRVCWEAKVNAYVRQRGKDLKKEHSDLVFIRTEGPTWGRGDAEERAFGKVLNTWEYAPTKKGTTGARPALVISGPGSGELRWVTTRAERPRRVRHTGPRTLVQRRGILDARRCYRIVDVVQAKLLDAKAAMVLVPKGKSRLAVLGALAVTFGTADRVDRAGNTEKDWKGFDGLNRKKPAELEAALWQQVKRMLVSRLDHQGPTSSYRKHYSHEVTRVAKLIGLDVNRIRDQVVKEMPEPESWAKLNEDGTKRAELTATARTRARAGARLKGMAKKADAKKASKTK